MIQTSQRKRKIRKRRESDKHTKRYRNERSKWLSPSNLTHNISNHHEQQKWMQKLQCRFLCTGMLVPIKVQTASSGKTSERHLPFIPSVYSVLLVTTINESFIV
jgi:hypothetical protein